MRPTDDDDDDDDATTTTTARPTLAPSPSKT